MDLAIEDVDDLCVGAALLGAGGGGDPYIGGLIVKRELAAGRRIRIVDPDDLADDRLVIPTAMMGAPTVLLEKIPSGEEPIRALQAVEAQLGRTADATMPTEVGGINSTIPLFVAARLGIPVVDADGQGRAFPETARWRPSRSWASPGRPWASPTRRATSPRCRSKITTGWNGSPAASPSASAAPPISPTTR